MFFFLTNCRYRFEPYRNMHNITSENLKMFTLNPHLWIHLTVYQIQMESLDRLMAVRTFNCLPCVSIHINYSRSTRQTLGNKLERQTNQM